MLPSRNGRGAGGEVGVLVWAFRDWLFGEAEDFPAHGDTKNPPPVEEGEGRGGVIRRLRLWHHRTGIP